MTRKPKPTGIIVYCRVSTEDQADKGMSLSAQSIKCKQYAKLYDLPVVEIISETASAKSLDRPLLKGALERLRRGEASGLLVAKLDRLTRSIRDIGALVDPGSPGHPAGPLSADKARLYSVAEQIDTGTASGRLVLNIIVVVAQWEREAIAERTRTAMQHMKAKGMYTGGLVPYGWMMEDGVLVQNESEAATLKRVAQIVTGSKGRDLSLRAIAQQLQFEGMLSRTGKRFGPAQIKRFVDQISAQEE